MLSSTRWLIFFGKLVCVRVCERENVCEGGCVCDRECVCVSVSVSAFHDALCNVLADILWQAGVCERERESVCERERECVCDEECLCVCVCVWRERA